MKRMEVPALAMIIIVWLGAQAEAQTPCPELVRLRNVATKAWKEAMRAPPSERCGALYHASLAAEATLKYADNNRESCDVSVPLLNQVERSTARRCKLARMLVLDVLSDHIQQISSNVETIESSVQFALRQLNLQLSQSRRFGHLPVTPGFPR